MKRIVIKKAGVVALTIETEKKDGKQATYIDSQVPDAEAPALLVRALCTLAAEAKTDEVVIDLRGKTNAHQLGAKDPFPHEN
jgi:hypothetical protein